jgi:DNA polymerase alpha subunit B
MYEKLSDRSDVLDRLLEEAAMTISDWYEIEEWADPSVISQEDIWAYGRICAETQDSKISDQACWLETSRMIGHGRRIRLQWADDLKVHGVGSHEEGIGLFPGAIVGLRGRNGGGTYFSVQEILSVWFSIFGEIIHTGCLTENGCFVLFHVGFFGSQLLFL